MHGMGRDILIPAFFPLQQKKTKSKKNTSSHKNIGDKIENPSVDLGINLGKNFQFWDLYIMENLL